MIAELAALALSCAPNIHPITLQALVQHESRIRQYAIGVNRKGRHLPRQPHTLAEATEAAKAGRGKPVHQLARGHDEFHETISVVLGRRFHYLDFVYARKHSPALVAVH